MESTDEILDDGGEGCFKKTMKAKLFALFIALLMVGCEKEEVLGEPPPPPSPTEILNAEGIRQVSLFDLEERDGIYYVKGENKPFTGTSGIYSNDGSPEEQSPYVDGKLHGTEVFYDHKGKPFWLREWKNGENIGSTFR